MWLHYTLAHPVCPHCSILSAPRFHCVRNFRRIVSTRPVVYKQSIGPTDLAVSSLTCHTATGTHTPCRITQCYLPPGKGDIPPFTPAEAELKGGCKAELTYLACYIPRWYTGPKTVIHPSSLLTGPGVC